jgi:hypothetical protein
VDIRLNYEQRARLELLSIHAGKPIAQMLTEAAQLLLDADAEDGQPPPGEPQKFLSEEELDARFAQLLRH